MLIYTDQLTTLPVAYSGFSFLLSKVFLSYSFIELYSGEIPQSLKIAFSNTQY